MGKSKLVVGIILLLLGLGLLPTGLVLDRRINSELDAAVPDVLLQIREGFIPAATDLVKFEAIPQAMVGLKTELTGQIPYLLNGSITAQAINGTIFTLAESLDETTAKEMFFNDPAWSTNTGGVFPINSISEVMGQALGFTALSQNRTLFGSNPYPGILSDLEQGSGVFGYLQYYQIALTSSTVRNALTAAYNATWDQLGNLTAYLNNYMFPLVPTLGSLPFPADETTAASYFYFQWANATLVPDGIILPIQGGIEAWELGVKYSGGVSSYFPSNLSLPLTIALWNSSDPHSPFNYTGNYNDGFHYWYSALTDESVKTDILTEFGIASDEFDLFTNYFFDVNFQDRVIVPLVEEDQSMSFENFVLNQFYLQWSTGALIPEGIASLGPEYSALDGFEIVLPSDNIPFSLGPTRCRNMWDPVNLLSLTNPEGVQDWLAIMRIEGENYITTLQNIESSIQFPLMSLEFIITSVQTYIIGQWLYRFRNYILPQLVFEAGLFFMHPTELANMIALVGYTVGGFFSFLGVISILSYRKR